MSHKDLSVKKRYALLFILLFCLIGIGCALLKSWNQTPEMHFLKAMELMDDEQTQKAAKFFVLAQKSKVSSIRRDSSLYLAQFYHHGTKEIPVNMEKAAFYYEQAASLKSIDALYTLALLYDAGDKIPENREKAKDYMTQAAEVSPKAQYALAVWIERGYFGEPDMERVVKLYEKAANHGIQNAMKSLISIYHSGFGTFPKNIQREHFWRVRLL